MGWELNRKTGKLEPEDTEGQQVKMEKELINLAKGLIMAKLAMPNTHIYGIDSRMKLARRILKRYKM